MRTEKVNKRQQLKSLENKLWKDSPDQEWEKKAKKSFERISRKYANSNYGK